MTWPCLLQHLGEDRGRAHCAGQHRCSVAPNKRGEGAIYHKHPKSGSWASPLSLGCGPSLEQGYIFSCFFHLIGCLFGFPSRFPPGAYACRLRQGLGVREPRGCAALQPLAGQGPCSLRPPRPEADESTRGEVSTVGPQPRALDQAPDVWVGVRRHPQGSRGEDSRRVAEGRGQNTGVLACYYWPDGGCREGWETGNEEETVVR